MISKKGLGFHAEATAERRSSSLATARELKVAAVLAVHFLEPFEIRLYFNY